MKLINVYDSYKIKYNNYIILIKCGIFYDVFNEDTSIMYSLFHYKIKNTGNNYLIGFPIKNINKVTEILKYKKINYIILEKNNDNYEIVDKFKNNKNNYSNYIFDTNKLNYLESRINNIKNKLLLKLDDNDIENILLSIESIL